jgi:hypothetical protein
VSPGIGNGGGRDNWPRSAHEARRFILDCLPECEPLDNTDNERESYTRRDEPAELIVPDLIETTDFRAIQIADPRATRLQSGFGAFLDGTQDVRKVNHFHGVPIVWGTVSAAIRARMNRRLVSWPGHAPIVRRRYYIPFRYVDGLPPDLLVHADVADTMRANAQGIFPSRHPAALMEAAVQRVQQDREAIELELAEAWCSSGTSTLYMDGSLSGSAVAATSPLAVGVIKSHRRLYAEGAAFGVLVGMDAGQRSSVFRVSPRGRHAVASWYVRVRPPKGRDPLFGLVRVESAHSADISARADEVSRWIIAEGSPLALPDGRWDRMAYGIRHTEEFLRAIS